MLKAAANNDNDMHNVWGGLLISNQAKVYGWRSSNNNNDNIVFVFIGYLHIHDGEKRKKKTYNL